MMDTKTITDWINNNKDYILEKLSELVKIKTINYGSFGNEKLGQEYIYNFVSDFLPKKNIDMFEIDDVAGIRENSMFVGNVDGVERDYKNRSNLVAKLKGRGGGKSISFSGHIDVVPVMEEKWVTFENPFSGKIKDGKMYGRGTIDMKSGLISNFFALKCLKDLNISLRGDVYAESVVDEELGGVNGTIAARLRYPNIDFSILTETTDLKVGIESRGGSVWKVTFAEEGFDGFSQATNPICKISEFVLFLEEFNEFRNRKVIYPVNYKGEKHLRLIEFVVHAGGRNYLENASYLPKVGKLYFYLTTLPNTPEEVLWGDFLDFMKKKIQKSKYLKNSFPKIEKSVRYYKGHSTNLNHSGMTALRNAYKTLKLNYVEQNMWYLCDTEAFSFGKTEVVIVGPVGNNFHTIDEYVDIDSIYKLIKILVVTTINYCS